MVVEARCLVCGVGATRLVAGLGALIALSWSTELGGFRWAHRTCAETAGLVRRALPPLRFRPSRLRVHA